MPRALRDNGIALVFGGLCLITIAGEALVGVQVYNQEAIAHREDTISLGRYVVSSEFGANLMENWQSEFLQFATFIVATIWLVQRGSAESKAPEQAGTESDRDQRVGRFADEDSPLLARVGGLPQKLYANSLFLAMLLLFLATWAAQSLTGWSDFNADQLAHDQPTLNWIHYVGTPEFWERSFQNWQSEFLAVATMAIFTVYLRQRGSPESKPVGEAHHRTTSDE